VDKVGLYIVDTLHALTQKGYRVQFIQDLPGMLTIVYTNRDSDNAHHDHAGVPGGTALQLEKEVIKSLNSVLERVK
jgi:hypothetical protein